MRDTRCLLHLSSAVSAQQLLRSTTAQRHPRSFVLHRTTQFHRSIGSAVIAGKPLQIPQTKGIHQHERVHGNVYMTTHPSADQVHLMAVC
ncbi:hypothetical protein [Stenotrophomonas maltophilia]|uniref:hypothetical protein n=1 Tax=Stenotrophomonas maltophilia TaxID=40324 RepID=UPI0019541A9B|nr:hypothetical protein [Stenotrophomonas maltophilia]